MSSQSHKPDRMPPGPDRPCFIICIGRSGSTLLHEVLCSHPSAAWLTQYDDRFPDWGLAARALLTLRDLPIVGPRAAARSGPHEAWQFWEHNSPGFRVPGRDLVAEDVTPDRVRRLRAATRIRTSRRRGRLILKVTGWPRMRFLAEVFPDARFVHLVRDGRAVARSQVKQSWWTGAGGPDRWAWGPLPERYRRQWLGSRRSQVQLAAIAWEMMLDAVADCKRALDPSRLLQVRYEDLCREPRSKTEEILTFLELDWADQVEAELRSRSIEDRNNARGPIESEEWRDLGPLFQQHLAHYEYT